MKKIKFVKILPLVIAAALSLGLSACKNNADDDSTPVVAGAEVAAGTVGELPATLKSCASLAKSLDPSNNEVILFYYRNDGNYSPWGLWLWPDGGDGQAGYTDTSGKFQKDSASGLGYMVLNSSLLTTATDVLACINGRKNLNFIIRNASWEKDPGDNQIINLTSGNKHFLVISGDKSVYSVTENLNPEIVSATMESATTIKVKLSVSYGLETSASSNGFTLTANDGASIKVSDVVNYDYQSNRNKNNATNLLVTLASVVDTSKTYTLSHEKFGSKVVLTSGVISLVLGDYVYSGDDLGLTLNGNTAGFKIWAPTASDVQLLLYANANDVGSYDSAAVAKKVAGSTTDSNLKGTPISGYPKAMAKNSEGIWSISGVDVSGAKYYKYQITVGSKTYYVCDINAKCASADSIAAQIIDINSDSSAKPASGSEVFDGTVTGYKNPFKGSKYNDAVIYEMHIRDWSRAVVSDSTGKFLDIANSTEIINHLKDLGVTHVQILPMFDYAQVNSDTNYNWGYNPYHYNVPEGRYVDYSSNADGTAAVAQMRTMIQTLHDAGIAVNMDVVYNHTSGTETGSLYDSTVPFYYYRMNSDGSYSNGSGCGNETNSGAPMFKKYMIDSLKHWMLDYHINGFRFDLMGLHETETMQKIYEELSKIDSKVMVYGEPWTGGTSPVKNGATKASKASSYGFAVFDDAFRDAVKGAEFGGLKTGQVQGNVSDEGIINGLKGLGTRNESGLTGLLLRYAECHDNFTLYDKLVYSLESNIESAKNADSSGKIATVWPSSGLSVQELSRVKSQDKLAAAYIILAQGTPFINGGQEFMRTKKGNPDSYAADKKGGITWTNESGAYNIDDVNTINLALKNSYEDVYKVYKGLIALRKSTDAFASPKSVSAKTISNVSGKIKSLITQYTCSGVSDTYSVYYNANLDGVKIAITTGGKEIVISSGSVEEGENIDAGERYLQASSFLIIKHNN